VNAASRPATLPDAAAYPHGKRARYVTGCRCRPCTASNSARYRARAALALERLADIERRTPAREVVRTWRPTEGAAPAQRRYRSGCPGSPGLELCPYGSYLRKDSKGGICGRCRELLVWNGLVDARRARRHLRGLSSRGVGRDAVAAAADVGVTTIAAITSGRKIRIRAEVERRLLGVDEKARADASLVDAALTWRMIARLCDVERVGFTPATLAKRLGYKCPALQFGKRKVLARTALKIERFYRLVMS
jgi:hypothetical protein